MNSQASGLRTLPPCLLSHHFAPSKGHPGTPFGPLHISVQLAACLLPRGAPCRDLTHAPLLSSARSQNRNLVTSKLRGGLSEMVAAAWVYWRPRGRATPEQLQCPNPQQLLLRQENRPPDGWLSWAVPRPVLSRPFNTNVASWV